MPPITLPAPDRSLAPSFLIRGRLQHRQRSCRRHRRRTPIEKDAWVAACLILVGGVSQVSLGLGKARLANRPPGREVILAQLATFNLGGGLLVLALGIYLWTTRWSSGGWVLRVFRLLIAIVLVSIPVGLVLVRLGD